MRPIKITAGEDATLQINTNIDLSSGYSEVEFRAWSGSSLSSITKKYTDGDITLSATSITVSIADSDTASLEPGDYRLELRATTTGGAYKYARFSPDRLILEPSSWATTTRTTDYTSYP